MDNGDFEITKEHLRRTHAKTYGSGRIESTFKITDDN